jgi:hypothetical protein
MTAVVSSDFQDCSPNICERESCPDRSKGNDFSPKKYCNYQLFIYISNLLCSWQKHHHTVTLIKNPSLSPVVSDKNISYKTIVFKMAYKGIVESSEMDLAESGISR